MSESLVSEKNRTLATLRVASPCPVAWDTMCGDDRVRFCKQCHLNVYNISAMTAPEAEAFLAQHTGRLCVQYLFRRGDGKIITRDCPVGWRAVRWQLVRAAVTAVAMLANAVCWSYAAAGLRKPTSLNPASDGAVCRLVQWSQEPPPPMPIPPPPALSRFLPPSSLQACGGDGG